MPQTSFQTIISEIILKTINGEIFSVNLNTYFDEKKRALNVAAIPLLQDTEGEAPLEDASIETLVNAEEQTLYYIQEILENCINNISGRKDNPFLDDDNTTESRAESDIIRAICHIFEAEVSLFDEKKTHYEVRSIIKDIKDQKERLRKLRSALDLSDSEIIKVFTKFSEYIDFIIRKAEFPQIEEIKTEFDGCKFYPYFSLLEIEQILDPNGDRSKFLKKKFKEQVKVYYDTSSLGIDLVNNPDTDLEGVLFVDLYLYFGYVKNHEFSEESHLEAYTKMYNLFIRFIEKLSTLSGSDNEIKNRIRKTNIVFLINYLISTLASAFKSDTSLNNVTPDKVEEYKEQMQSLVSDNENDEEYSYFTYHKMSRLYLGISNYYLNRGEIKKSRDYIKLAKESLTEARKRYNLPGGGLLKFYPDIEVLNNSGVFSLSGFCRVNGSDFTTRLFSLEFDMMESLSLIVQKEAILKITASEEKLAESEKNTSLKITASEEKLAESEKNTSKHNIEILSIFAALVMFVSGNIQIYQYISSLKSAIVFMVFFALSLGIFGLVLREWGRIKPISTNGSTKKKIWFFIKENLLFDFLIILAIICGVFLYSSDDTTLSNKKYIDEVKDELRGDMELSRSLKNEQTQFKNEVINIHENDKYQDARN